ncbi:MAG: bifunctional phosphopantothenoylcysteine decarboxylase/phosphopantothenate--cysteine ligase CoaBC [Alphaproteobacteria bacterium]|nr:bifunctional phosphopantothenoylcysteine decarboxylase/phosphopantothenate--cysteine ligase CoaBC [Alphaproteobacteria bacterium]
MEGSLFGRRVLLIISGGIAAYKSLELVRLLQKEGAIVHGLLTQGGQKFITPLSVSALTGAPVATDLFSSDDDERLSHINLSRQNDLIVVAPATANLLAKMAHGLADNLASAVLLASNVPVLVAPAMNSVMWAHPATEANIATLRARGVLQVGPARGFLACGEEGEGRMVEPLEILDAVRGFFQNAAPSDQTMTGALSGLRALVTSGPTYEPLDPVRFLGNHSSGKQGHAIAAALAAQGADVTLVSGPTCLEDPKHVHTIHVQTARQMLEACQKAGAVDVVVCAAAVADWRPVLSADTKMKKGLLPPSVMLTVNPDILETLATQQMNRARLVVGFAAETDHVVDYAKAKLLKKGCDWILANQVGQELGFGKDDNEIIFLKRLAHDEIAVEPWPRLSKQDVAERLALQVAQYFAQVKRDAA